MPEGNMFARLCNPTAGRRFMKIRVGDGTKRDTWGNGTNRNLENQAGNSNRDNEEVAGAVINDNDSSSSDDEEEERIHDNEFYDDDWPDTKDVYRRLRHGTQCLDLLETCWTLEKERILRLSTEEADNCISETESEPGPDREEIAEEINKGMGQRASSTSSLHVINKSPITTPPGRVSLKWAILKRQPSSASKSNTSRIINTTSTAQPQQPIKSRESSARSNSSNSKTITTSSSQSSSQDTEDSLNKLQNIHRQRSHQSSSSNSTIKNFGYDIHDVDEFLSKASLQNPANIPVVLSTPAILYQPGTRRSKSGRGSWRQNELSLPLGMVVNAVFRSHSWLYVHTPHGEAGYVRYKSCLPLGILPTQQTLPNISNPSTPAPGAWDIHTDAFPPPPPPCTGRVRRGATSVCDIRHHHRHYRNNKTDSEKLRDTVSESGVSRNHRSQHRHRHHRTNRPEEVVDRLFLESQSRNKTTESKYACKNQSSVAQRTSIETLLKDAEYSARRYRAELDRQSNIDTISVKDSVSQCGIKYRNNYNNKIINEPTKREKLYSKYDLEKTMKILANYNVLQQQQQKIHKIPSHRTVGQQTDSISDTDIKSDIGKTSNGINRSKSRGAISECNMNLSTNKNRFLNDKKVIKAETLLLIRSDYNSRGRNTLSVSKGDVVVLVSAKLKDWFWVRRGDGCEGFIPSVVAGHGFL